MELTCRLPTCRVQVYSSPLFAALSHGQMIRVTLLLVVATTACVCQTYDTADASYAYEEDEADASLEALVVNPAGCIAWCNLGEGAMCNYDPCETCVRTS